VSDGQKTTYMRRSHRQHRGLTGHARSVSKVYKIRRGEQFATERKQQATDLTADLLRNDEWTKVEFKEYNWKCVGGAAAVPKLRSCVCAHAGGSAGPRLLSRPALCTH
jgi:hypothetical protein